MTGLEKNKKRKREAVKIKFNLDYKIILNCLGSVGVRLYFRRILCACRIKSSSSVGSSRSFFGLNK
jgi:hypothetical protein